MSESATYATYALLSPSGQLVFRPDGPKQMRQDVALEQEAPHEFTIFSASSAGPGLHGCVTSVNRSTAPPNHVAATMIAELGGPDHDQWAGIVGLCGINVDNPTGEIALCGLTGAQRRLIQAVHSAACARYAGIES